MSHSEAKIEVNRFTKLTTNAFKVETRVKVARKANQFWNEKHSKPSKCVVIRA